MEDRNSEIQKEKIEIVRVSWKNDFTDPQKHNPHSFCYLVHGIQSALVRNIEFLAIYRELRKYDPTQDIDLLRDPQRISDKERISCSIIDQEHTETYGAAGLILAAPFENVLSMFSQEEGTGFSGVSSVRGRSSNLLPVPELLKRTHGDLYNEVVITGKTMYGLVQVKGFWVNTDKGGVPFDEETAYEIEYLARKLNLPLITIIKEFPEFRDGPPEIYYSFGHNKKPVQIIFNREGFRYCANFCGMSKFEVVDKRREFHPMTSEQFEFFKRTLERELNEKQKEKLRDLIDQLDERFREYMRRIEGR